jgi:hypothetical protein
MITAKRAVALAIAALVPMFALAGAEAASRATPVTSATQSTPPATVFAAKWIGVTNQYAKEHGVNTHAGDANCVQASPGHYMCSYSVTKNGAATCHLMQARWTPGRASTITVTLAGRTAKCTTLREAIQTLR